MIYSVLLPQVRAKANASADRSRALKALGKSVRHLDKSDPKLFLGEFNRMLAAFLKIHGTDDDMKRLDEPLEVINAVLYGRRIITSEQASEATAAVIDVLKSKRVDADE